MEIMISTSRIKGCAFKRTSELVQPGNIFIITEFMIFFLIERLHNNTPSQL